MVVPVQILFFAKAREITGKQASLCELETPILYDNLLAKITETFGLGCIKNNFILAVNENFVDCTDLIVLKAGDEIAVIPPISGG